MPRKKTIPPKILRFLEGETVPQSPKIIAAGIRENSGSVRNALKRMKDKGEIVHDGTGYLSPNVIISDIGAIYKELRIHGINLMYEGNMKDYKIHTNPYLRLHANYTIHEHQINHSITLKEEWNGYQATITIHKKPKIMIWLKCGDTGLTIMEFYGFSNWVKGLFPKILASQWKVIQYGLNIDYPRLQLKGVEDVSLMIFEKSLLRLYNKNKERLRVEFHGNIPITMDQAILLLSNMITETKKLVVNDMELGK